MSEFLEPSDSLGRRLLLGRGAAVAGAAAVGAVALGVGGARPAAAADGDALKQGTVYVGTKRTGVTVNSATEPALQVANSTGPALKIVPTSAEFDGDLKPGEVTADPFGPVVGVADSDGNAFASPVATLSDLDALSQPFAISPARLVDTRNEAGRSNILNPGSLDSSGRLKAGQYIDVAVDVTTEDYTVSAVFVNVTSTGSTGNGFLAAYPPGTRPTASTLNYSKGVTIANFALVSTGAVDSNFVVRIYSSTPTHVIVDQTGALVSFLPGPSATAKMKKAGRRSASRRRVQSWKATRRR
ncbi:MAG: hypothetical protein ACRYG2_32425 [Janthinobacterium lividum]